MVVDASRLLAIELSHDAYVVLRPRSRLPKVGAALTKLGLRQLSDVPGEWRLPPQ
jgi:hypothetical protein